MKYAGYYVDPAARHVEASLHPTNTREHVLRILGLVNPYAQLTILRLGADAIGQHASGAPITGELVAVAAEQPAAPHAADVYWIRGVPVVGPALIAVREPVAEPIALTLSAQTHLYPILTSGAEISEMIEWSREQAPANVEPVAYDRDMLDSFARLMVEQAKPYGVGFWYRLHALDVDGREAATVNVTADFRELRNTALRFYDQGLTVYFENVLRQSGAWGISKETAPHAVTMLPAKDGDLRITAPDGVLTLKLANGAGKLDARERSKVKTLRIPAPGLPVQRPDGAVLVTWTRLDDREAK
jgi:hypothetical protein